MRFLYRISAVVLLLCASAVRADTRNGFVLGGALPFWMVQGEHGTASFGPTADAARAAVQPRINEMFDIIIPSAISWDWVEPLRGRLDFHRYRWALSWAQANRKQVLTQHLFWMWRDSLPRWAQRLRGKALRAALHQHIADVEAQIGQVRRLTVINEMACENYLSRQIGQDVVRELFVAARARFPDTQLFLNEHFCPAERFNTAIIGQTLARYAELVQRLEAQNVPFDKVGLQLYFGQQDVEALGGIEHFVAQVSVAISQFSRQTGRPIFITELGFASADETYRAAFMQQFLTMVRDHDDVEGLIVFHWLDEQERGTALVSLDGSLTPAGEVFYQVFGR